MEYILENLYITIKGFLILIGIVLILLIPEFVKGIIELIKLKKQTKKDKEEIQKRIEENEYICIIRKEEAK